MAGASSLGEGRIAVGGFGRAWAILRDRSDSGRARLFAASAFAARVTNAGLGFLIQVLLARWMGDHEYGVYASIWVWFLMVGGIGSLALPIAAMKLVPDYRERGDGSGLRGFLNGARLLGPLPSLLATALLLAILVPLSGRIGPYGPVVLIALAAVPFYVLMDIQTGIARASDFADLGLMADYVVRPLLLLASVATLALLGWTGTATLVMTATALGVSATAAVQGVALQRRLRARGWLASRTERRDVRRWARLSWPMLLELGFMLLLGSTDIVVLQLYVLPEDIGPYYAATKIMAIASFVSYGVSNTSAHRFAVHVARGDAGAMTSLAARTVRWTFWPTLAIAALLSAAAPFLLHLFGPGFDDGVPVVAILGLGLVAAASVGPADRALAMADHGRLAAAAYAIAFAANVVFCFALVPRFGLVGAAAGASLALCVKAALLFVAAKRQLGLRMTVLPSFAR